MPRRRTEVQRKPPPPPRIAIVTAANPAEGSPLAFMLEVMRDRTADPKRRDRMAIAAAPYLHIRAELKGKKAVQVEAAMDAGTDTAWSEDLQYLDGMRQ